MLTWFRRFRQTSRVRRPADQGARLTLESLEDRCLLNGSGFAQTALTSSVPGLAVHNDPALINPWSFTETANGQFLISVNGAGNAPQLTAQGSVLGPPVLLPPPLGSAPGTTTTPDGQVANTTSNFIISLDGRSAPATTIFATEDGTLIGYNPQVDSKEGALVADLSASGAVFKGLATGSAGGANFLYATDFHNNAIDVFDKNFHKVALGANGFGTFTDPHELAGYAPFGIQNINGVLFVTYAKQLGPDNHDDQAGPGNGFIDEFDASGNFLKRLTTGGTLNSPFGLTIAPAGFGSFGGDLLVGNFGDSRVSAYDPNTGVFLGQLTDAQGNILVLNGGFQGTDSKGLWGIGFGNGQNGAGANTLFFAAGINDENDGLFGKVDVVPPPKNQPAPVFVQTNLVSDIPGLAETPDPHLVNPWGLTASGTSPFWVANNNDGTSTLYTGQGAIVPLVVTIPTNTITTPPTLGSPSGTVANTFHPGFDVVPGNASTSAAFLFDTEDGNIDAWAGGPAATVEVNNPNAGYKGLTLGTDSAGDNLLYAANFAQGTIDVYDQNFLQVEGAPGAAGKSPITLAGNFTDPNLPSGFAPFNIQEIAGNLYVEYAQFDPTTTEGVRGAGLGFVDVYNNDGVLLTPGHLISGGALNAPWGVALAPANFGQFSNDLLVGNFGDGRINAFDPKNGTFLGALTLANGQPFQEDNLWALRFGNGDLNKTTGAVAAPTNTLYFTTGIENQQHGLFGSLQAVPAVNQNASILASLPIAPHQTFSTVPANGDVNPYGVAFVPQGFQGVGVLNPGDLLVSNFNNNVPNAQGTGTTIVQITPAGQTSVFFQGAPGLGLTTALGVLKSGFVIVGNLPTDVNGATQQGSLLILNANGQVVSTLTSSTLLNGPWDLAVNDLGNTAQVFVANVLSGTVTRINLSIPNGGIPRVVSETQIASGFTHRLDPNALVVGPTGLAFNAQTDTLYVASTGDNAVYAIHNAATLRSSLGTGQLIFNDPTTLHGPLGLTLAPNGNLILTNGDAVNPDPNHPNELVEITPLGKFVSQFQLDSGPGGGAFGVAAVSVNGVVRFAAVDDDTNTVQIWTLQQPPAGNLLLF